MPGKKPMGRKPTSRSTAKAKPLKETNNGMTNAEKFPDSKLDELLQKSAEVTLTETYKDEYGHEREKVVKRKYSTKEQIELRRKQVFKLTLHNVPKVIIADYMNVSVETIYKDLQAIGISLRTEATVMDMPTFIGITNGFYDHVRGHALMMSQQHGKGISQQHRINALMVALKAEEDKQKFLERTGLFEAVNPAALWAQVNKDFGKTDDAADLQKVIGLLENLPIAPPQDDIGVVDEQPLTPDDVLGPE